MKFQDYYQILGVARNATQDEIKKAYRRLARKYHPDVSKERDAEARFKELGEAYEVLKDPEKRAAYDRLGAQWKAGQDFTPPPGWDFGFEFRDGRAASGGSHHFSDFFEFLFGSASPFNGFQQRVRTGTRSAHTRRENQRVKIVISLEEAYQGATKDVQLQVPAFDAFGRGHTRMLRMKIPRGITQGRQIRLAAQGAPGPGGAPTGDLYLVIEFEPHPLYRVEGKDIYLNLPIAPWEAALGAKVAVPTLGGPVDLTIPPGSQSAQKLRLRGRGLGGDAPGDQYVVLQIVTPEANTATARELYRRMEREMPFNPRARLKT
jgi:DnaJ-class molecular chaperone with C-terminal Zn finger domain